MKLQKKWVLLTFILTFTLLACGLGDVTGLINSEEIAETIVEQVNETVAEEVPPTSEVTESEQNTEQAAAAAAQADSQAADEATTTENSSEAEQTDAAAVQADSQAADEATTENLTGAEGVPLPITNIKDVLANIDSYQARYQVEMEVGDGSGGVIKSSIFTEETKDPPIAHIVIENEGGDSQQLGDFNRLEFYIVEDNNSTTVYMPNVSGGEGWMAINTSGSEDIYKMMPISLDALDMLPAQSRVVGPEEINGMATTHYTYNQNDFMGLVSGLEEAQGDAWITADNILIKLVQHVSGSGLSAGTGQQLSFAAYTMTFEIEKLNDSSIVISLPEGILSGIPGSGSGGNSQSGDLPMLDDAVVIVASQDMLNYATAQTVQATWEFYETRLPAEGWTLTNTLVNTSESIVAQFEREGSSLNLAIQNDAGETKVVMLMTQ